MTEEFEIDDDLTPIDLPEVPRCPRAGCGARMLVSGEAAVCDLDHRWMACRCRAANCPGWRRARWQDGTWV